MDSYRKLPCAQIESFLRMHAATEDIMEIDAIVNDSRRDRMQKVNAINDVMAPYLKEETGEH
jgi:hypothetical protein